MRLKSDSAWLVPIVALFIATFAVNTAENIVAGLLPAIAADMHVDIPTAGQLITGYALAVAIVGPMLALITTGMSRRNLLLGIMAVFILSNIGCATATSYPVLLAARLLTAASNGLFFGIAVVIASQLAAKGRETSAVSLVVAGTTAAAIAGVPIGTVLGNAYGWHTAFWVLALAGLVAAALLALLIPTSMKQERLSKAQLFAELSAALRPRVLLCYAIIVFFSLGAFILIAYMVPLLTQVVGVPLIYVPLVLFGLGFTGFFGNLVGGRLGDWKPLLSLVGILAVWICFSALFATIADNRWPAIVNLLLLWFVGFGFVAPIQSRILQEASAAPNFAATLISTAFNIGLASAAAIGGAAITAWGYRALPWLNVTSECFALAATLVLIAATIPRRLVRTSTTARQD
jgi:DHA1 family inner membrane transport protein